MKKPDYFYIQSGVIPFRWVNGKLEVLLITSRRKQKWIIPKGIIEPDLTIKASAAKEALEEAGIEGEVLPIAVGEYSAKKWEGECSIQVYPMKVTKIHERWEEDSFRKRKWVTLEKARDLISKKKLKKMFNSLNENDPRFEK